MPNANQYLPFATGGGANTISNTAYAAHALRAGGHVPGVALSELVNTTFRQTTVGVSALAQFAADYGTHDVLDDGTLSTFEVAFKSAIDAIIANQQFWTAGDVKGTMVNVVPTGWLKANGQIVLRATYPALFAAIGTQFNTGIDGAHFQLPDLRGEFLRGWDDGRGLDPSRALGNTQTGSIQAHTHTYNSNPVANPGGAQGGSREAVGVSADTTGSTGGTETRPHNVSVLWLIKT